jgi:hypothetical protein
MSGLNRLGEVLHLSDPVQHLARRTREPHGYLSVKDFNREMQESNETLSGDLWETKTVSLPAIRCRIIGTKGWFTEAVRRHGEQSSDDESVNSNQAAKVKPFKNADSRLTTPLHKRSKFCADRETGC